MQQSTVGVKQKINEFFGWIFGLSLLTSGFLSALQLSLASIPLLLFGCMFIPPIGAFIDEKIPLSNGKKIGLVFILMILMVFFMKLDENKRLVELEAQQVVLQKQAEEEKRKQQENINFFNDNRTSILADIRQSIKSKKYSEAVALSSKYLSANDKELSTLNNTANTKLLAMAKSQTEETRKVEARKQAILERQAEENDSRQILEGIDIEVSDNILEYLEISNCETSLPLRYFSYEIDCVFKYKGTTGEIVPYFFGAIAYDKDGVRLKVQGFPNQNILPNQPVKSPLILNVPISDVRKIVIGISDGNSVITK